MLFLSFFLSIFSPFYSEPCGWKALRAPARHQGCASGVGKPTSGHWSTTDLPAPCNTKRQKSLRDLHLNIKIQLHSTTSKLQCWTPYPKNSKTGTQPHSLAERLPKIIIRPQTPQNTPPDVDVPHRKTRSSLIHQNTGTSSLHQEAYTTHWTNLSHWGQTPKTMGTTNLQPVKRRPQTQ